MKKQFLFIAVTISAVLFSCTKEKIETKQNQPLESTVASQSSIENSGQLYINTLNMGLAGRFEFNGNLKDQTGKLADGTSVGRGAVSYTTDRKGNAASALYLTGYYGVNLSDVPEQTNASLTVWAKSLNSDYHFFVTPSGSGNLLSQSTNTFLGGETITSIGGYATSMGIGSADNQWHHLAVTFDGANIRIYKDGVLKATTSFAGTFAQYLAKYYLGYHPNQSGYWKGCLDELRFYSRTITSSEVQSLASL